MRRLLVSVAALMGLVTVGLVTAPATVAGAASPSPIYNSIESPLPGNLPSLGYQATQASEAGNQISFSSGSGRVLQNVEVTLSSWGCQTGSWSTDDCSTNPGATFSEPVTLNLYDVGSDGTSVGTKFSSVTQTFNIPYRPSADANYATDCAADAAAADEPVSDFAGTWYDATDGHCYNGLDNNITFNLANVTVPNTLIYGIAFSTSGYGPAPYGYNNACNSTEAGCPYDSLNLALSNDPADVSVGTDPQQGTIYWNTATAANYCDDGAAGTGTFRIDSPGYPTCWSEDGSGNAPYYVPSVQFDAVSPSSTTSAPTSSSIVLGGTNTDGVTVTGTATSGAPTGNVQFYECGPTTTATPCTSTAHAVGSAVSLTLGSGDTSTATSPAFTPTAAGYWCFSGVYSGDSNYETSTDATVDECFHVTAASSSSVTAPGASSVVFGTNDGDTLTVTGNAAGGSPTGNVQFYVCGPTSVPTACTSTSDPISLAEVHAAPSDTATAISEEFTPTSEGYWCFGAHYLGSSNYTASTDDTTDECFLTTLAPTSVTSTPTNSTINVGQSDTDLAIVHGGNSVGGSPSGTVSFYECGPTTTAVACTSTAHRVGSPVTTTAASGGTSRATSASFKPTAVGYWCYAARYSGTTQYAASTGKAVNECVDVKGPVTILTKSLPAATKGEAYSVTLAARGGTTPYTWAHTGSLPLGIKMKGDVISGTALKSGSFSIVVKVRDSSKPETTASQSLTLTVNP